MFGFGFGVFLVWKIRKKKRVCKKKHLNHKGNWIAFWVEVKKKSCIQNFANDEQKESVCVDGPFFFNY